MSADVLYTENARHEPPDESAKRALTAQSSSASVSTAATGGPTQRHPRTPSSVSFQQPLLSVEFARANAAPAQPAAPGGSSSAAVTPTPSPAPRPILKTPRASDAHAPLPAATATAAPALPPTIDAALSELHPRPVTPPPPVPPRSRLIPDASPVEPLPSHVQAACSSPACACPVDAVPVPNLDPAQLRMPRILPSWGLIVRQLQQTSLWDRLFTHCTGRDLLCKLVQHGSGVLRCLLRLWAHIYARLAQQAAFRRMFTRVAEGKPLLPFLPPIGVLKPIMNAAASTAASIADPSASHSIAIMPLLSPSVVGDTALDDAEVCLPPTGASSLLARLAHVSYTMYRARQVLRLGRWIYDIPDVRDSALELWRGHGEEKSMEEQEAEEEWEEHERVHVVRSRRTSLDGSGSSIPRDGRGAFTFPLSARTPTAAAMAAGPAMSPSSVSPHRRSVGSTPTAPGTATGTGTHPSRASSMVVLPVPSFVAELPRHSSSSSSIAASTDDSPSTTVSASTSASSSTDSDPHSAPAAAEAGEAGEEEEEEDDEEDESVSLAEWSLGVVDLCNSLMGLLIDASDDVEFISSLGLLPERAADVAGQVASYLWLVSGGVDVAMCVWKLYEYRCEMREQLEEKRAALVALQAQAQQQCKQLDALRLLEPAVPDFAADVPAAAAGWATVTPCRLHARDSASDPDPDASLQLVAQRPAPVVPALPLSLCTQSCDVDCVHIESIRLFRYVGELGLSVCGMLELLGRGEGDPRLEAVMEVSGLVSGIATFVKRGATHARSKSVVQRAESIGNLQLYS